MRRDVEAKILSARVCEMRPSRMKRILAKRPRKPRLPAASGLESCLVIYERVAYYLFWLGRYEEALVRQVLLRYDLQRDLQYDRRKRKQT